MPVDATSDTALFHEMVHAHHYTRGVRTDGTLAAGDLGGGGHVDVGVNKEEYATVGLGAYAGNPLTENAYRAEMRAANPLFADSYEHRPSYR